MTTINVNAKYYTFLKFLPVSLTTSPLDFQAMEQHRYDLQNCYPYLTEAEATKIAFREAHIREALFNKFCKAFPELSRKQALKIVDTWSNL
jgi:hypothetical protein